MTSESVPAGLTGLEAAILNRIQGEFPIVTDPYAEIARQVGSTADAVYAAVTSLRQRGIIRRIGGSFVARALGYASTLVAAKVDPAALEEVATWIGRHVEVTHNYARDGAYNLWFTLIAETQEHLQALCDEIRCHPQVEALYPLPAECTFKIRVDFRFAEETHARPA